MQSAPSAAQQRPHSSFTPPASLSTNALERNHHPALADRSSSLDQQQQQQQKASIGNTREEKDSTAAVGYGKYPRHSCDSYDHNSSNADEEEEQQQLSPAVAMRVNAFMDWMLNVVELHLNVPRSILETQLGSDRGIPRGLIAKFLASSTSGGLSVAADEANEEAGTEHVCYIEDMLTQHPTLFWSIPIRLLEQKHLALEALEGEETQSRTVSVTDSKASYTELEDEGSFAYSPQAPQGEDGTGGAEGDAETVVLSSTPLRCGRLVNNNNNNSSTGFTVTNYSYCVFRREPSHQHIRLTEDNFARYVLVHAVPFVSQMLNSTEVALGSVLVPRLGQRAEWGLLAEDLWADEASTFKKERSKDGQRNRNHSEGGQGAPFTPRTPNQKSSTSNNTPALTPKDAYIKRKNEGATEKTGKSTTSNTSKINPSSFSSSARSAGVEKFFARCNGFIREMQEADDTLFTLPGLAPPPRKLESEAHSYLAKIARKPELVTSYEQCVERWCADADRLLATGYAVSANTTSDSESPIEEQRRWSRYVIHVSALLEQSCKKENVCVSELLRLASGRSKQIVNRWVQTLDALRATVVVAQDAIRYLAVLNEVSHSLYEQDPQNVDIFEVTRVVPSIVTATVMTFSVSKGNTTTATSATTASDPVAPVDAFNQDINNDKDHITSPRNKTPPPPSQLKVPVSGTADRFTALFLRLVHQLIFLCKRYLERPRSLLDDLTPPEEGMMKIENCLDLRNAFLDSFRSETRKATGQALAQISFDRSKQQQHQSFSAAAATVSKSGGTAVSFDPNDNKGHSSAIAGLTAATSGSASAFSTATFKPQNSNTGGGGSSSFSEEAVYGKLELFCTRLSNIDEILHVKRQMYQIGSCGVDGIQGIMEKFKGFFNAFRQRAGDVLELRNNRFDACFFDFKNNVAALSKDLMILINNSFVSAPSAYRALSVLNLFRKLLVPTQSITHLLDEKCAAVFQTFLRELEAVRTQYESQKSGPPVERNMPPVAGAILWSRHLLRQIEKPMDLLRGYSNILQLREAKPVIRAYNALAVTLVTYEKCFLDAWLETLERVQYGLGSTLFVCEADSSTLLCNFDLKVLELIEEITWLRRLNISLPPSAKSLLVQRPRLLMLRSQLQNIAQDYTQIIEDIDEEVCSLFVPILQWLNAAINPGLTQLTWQSTATPQYVFSVMKKISSVKKLLWFVNTALELRVRASLEKIKNMQWVCFTEHNDIVFASIEDVLEAQVEHATAVAKEVNACSVEIATSVREIVHAVYQAQQDQEKGFISKTSSEQQVDETMSSAVDDVYTLMEQKVLFAIVEGMKTSVEAVRARLGTSTATQLNHQPMIQLEVILRGNEIQVCPSLEELQTAINKTARIMLEATKWIFRWSQDGQPPSAIPVALVQQALLEEVMKEHQEAQEAGDPILFLRREGGAASGRSPAPASNFADGIVDHHTSRNNKSGASSSSRAVADDIKVGPPPNDKLRNIYLRVGKNRKLTKAFLQLTGVIGGLSRQVDVFLEHFKSFDVVSHHSQLSRRDAAHHYLDSVVEGRGSGPPLGKLRVDNNGNSNNNNNRAQSDAIVKKQIAVCITKLTRFEEVSKDIQNTATVHNIGCLQLNLRTLKASLKNEISQWKNAYGSVLQGIARKKLDNLVQQIEDYRIRMSRPLQDLQDVSVVSNAVTSYQHQENELDKNLEPIFEAYDVLQRYSVRVPKEDLEVADALQSIKKDLARTCESSKDNLTRKAGAFCAVLIQEISAFDQSVKQLRQDYEVSGPNCAGIRPATAVERLKHFSRVFNERARRQEQLRQSEVLFGLQPRVYTELDFIGKEIKLLSLLYDLYTEVLEGVKTIDEMSWHTADLNEVEQVINVYRDKCNHLPKSLRDFCAYQELKQLLDRVGATIPYLYRLRDKSIRARHWEIISHLVKCTIDPFTSDVKLKHLLEVDLPSISAELDELLLSAVKEADIELKINKLAQEFSSRNIILAPFKNRGNLLLRSDSTSLLMQDLEDTQSLLTSLLNSRFNEVFKREILTWTSRLAATQERMDEWLAVQHAWVYMEAVFIESQDIARELPQEVKRFLNIDRQWVKIMKLAEENPNLIKLCAPGELLSNMLPHLKQYLEICQKSLVGYLHSKRVSFPRFFFLSDAQLLDILGHGTDPTTIQPHLQSLTSNVYQVNFDPLQQITGWISLEGEENTLSQPFATDSDIVQWLTRFLETVRNNVKTSCCSMREDLEKGFMEQATYTQQEVQSFTNRFPAQVALLGLQLLWTNDCEGMLVGWKSEKNAIPSRLRRVKSMLDCLVSSTLDPTLSPRERVKLETMITIQIHQLDVIVALAKNVRRIRGISDFDWQKQLRCQWRIDKDEVSVSITDVDLDYGYEYIGCVERLVVTDLTDRIYVSCVQAMSMYFGGAPTGPAGTGKTETTRDLGRACGRYFIVINCSEMMTSEGMAKLIRGTAQSGCWCGFDEINRIDIGILSVVASQIASVFHGLRDRKKTFRFVDGSTTNLDRNCAIFITMNPSYAGRTELPENMKSLFRPIAVIVPDRQAIIRARLAAAGYHDSLNLSKKIDMLYDLCSQQLGQQNHYDFGLRNILSVLRTSGPALREFTQSDSFTETNPQQQQQQAFGNNNNPFGSFDDTGGMGATGSTAIGEGINLNEAQVVLRVIQSMNLSKLVTKDAALFQQLLIDLFPQEAGNQSLTSSHEHLLEILKNKAFDRNVTLVSNWTNRILMLYDQWLVRHGLCLMGSSCTGKTTIISLLQDAISEMHECPCRVFRMNPKALYATEMFGSFDPKTSDWNDGVFVNLWRKAMRRKQDHHFLVVDGPVDSLWIENLNSVLDDTKVLTLANGDRMPLPNSLKILFETDSLNNASPATVSRLGLVYLAPADLGWEPLVHRWGKQEVLSQYRNVTKDVVEQMSGVIRANVPTLSEFVRGKNAHAPPISTEALGVINTLRFAGSLLASLSDRPLLNKDGVRIATFSLLWGFGSLLTSPEKDVPQFEQLVYKHCSGLDLPAAPAVDSTREDQRKKGGLSASGLSAEGNSAAGVPPKNVRKESSTSSGINQHGDNNNNNTTSTNTLSRQMSGFFTNTSGPSLMDFYIDPQCLWKDWSTLVPRYSESSTSSTAAAFTTAFSKSKNTTAAGASPFSSSISFVYTPDACRVFYFANLFTKLRQSFLLVGDTGTGKTCAIQKFLSSSSLEKGNTISKQFSFSYATSTTSFRRSLFSLLEKGANNAYGPPPGRSLLVYIDDVHLPKIGDYGDQPTNELLRQLLEDGGCFSFVHQNIEWSGIASTIFAASMKSADGGSNDIPDRLKRHFAVVSVPRPSPACISLIFSKLLARHLTAERRHNQFAPELSSHVKKLAHLVFHVWDKARTHFLPTPINFHYQYTLKDLTRIFSGVAMTTPISLGKNASTISSTSELISLICHELRRVLGDKLTTPEEKQWLYRVIEETLLEQKGMSDETQMDRPTQGGAREKETSGFSPRTRVGKEANTNGIVDEDTNSTPTLSRLLGTTQLEEEENHPWLVPVLTPEQEDEPDDETLEALRQYMRCISLSDVPIALRQKMDGYNTTHKKTPMNLVLSRFFVRNLLSLCRILYTQRGNGLLIGVGGSGKQSLVKLATYLRGSRLVALRTNAQTTTATLIDDMKEALKYAMLGNSVTFVLSDQEHIQDSTLEYANLLLQSGELPNFYQKDELEVLYEELRTAIGCSIDQSMGHIFTERVRDHIHVVCCFSPAGNELQIRVRRFPGFVQCCTIIYLPPWPMEALEETALERICASRKQQQLAERKELNASGEDNNSENAPASLNLSDEELKQLRKVASYCACSHKFARELCHTYRVESRKQVYFTPKNFLDFLTSFEEIRSTHSIAMTATQRSVQEGLSRMSETQSGVTKMRRELNEKTKSLQQAAKGLEGMLVDIQQRTAQAEEKTAEVEAVRNRLRQQAEDITAEKESADRDMEAALPTLREAEQALLTIKPDDISAVKKFLTPPVMVRRIMDGVLILTQKAGLEAPVAIEVDPTSGQKIIRPSWAAAKVMIADMGFLQTLLHFNKDSVTAEQVELLQPYLDQEDFTVERARVACGSLAGLCTWIRAMVKYFHISRYIQPKRIRVKIAESALRRALVALRRAEDDLTEQMKELNAVKAKYDAALNEKIELQKDTENTHRRLVTAEQLISGLDSELTRWNTLLRESAAKFRQLDGDAVTCAAFMNYCGPFNLMFRNRLLRHLFSDMERLKIPYTSNLAPHGFLVPQEVRSQWAVEGLPQDELSIQNAVIYHNTSRFSLLIDPQDQGKQWVQRSRPLERIVYASASSSSFLAGLEDALVNGKLLILENIEDNRQILADMRDILTCNFLRTLDAEGRHWISIATVGTKDVIVSNRFSLVLCTRQTCPEFSPELFSLVSVLEYSVTRKGLEDQLLSLVIQHEKASLEQERSAVLVEIHECQSTLHNCEQTLLQKLATSVGNLLDNTELVDVLSDIKDRVLIVQEKLSVARDAESSIQKAYEEYRPIASRGGVLFFSMLEMSVINHMYTCSLEVFLNHFRTALNDSPQNPFPPKRIESAVSFLTSLVHQQYLVGYYNDDKPIFLLSVALGVERENPKFEGELIVDLLLKGRVDSFSPEHLRFLQRIDWIPEDCCEGLASLSAFQSMRKLLHSIETDTAEWRKWFMDDHPELLPFPENVQQSSSPFQCFLVTRLLRQDRVLPAATKYIREVLGGEFTAMMRRSAAVMTAAVTTTTTTTTTVQGTNTGGSAGSSDLAHLATESKSSVPILFLLAEGVDPSLSLEAQAKKQKVSIQTVSMGTGQAASADRAVQQAAGNGGWVLLQNVHLSIEYCSALAELLRSARSNPRLLHEDFRLWLTAAPHPQFPVSLLQQSLHVSDEPPRGLRAGLLKNISHVTQDQLDSIPQREWPTLLYTASFIHTVLTERRRYGSQGWCGKYEFTSSDLSICNLYLYNHLYSEGKRGVMWKDIQYMLGEVYLGGRICDGFDKRIMTVYCDRWLNDNLFTRGFEFSKGYPCPYFNSCEDYREFISEMLPSTDSPEVYGLHRNAEIAQLRRSADRLLGQLSSAASVGTEKVRVADSEIKQIVSELRGQLLSSEIRTSFQTVLSTYASGSAVTNAIKKTPTSVVMLQEVQHVSSLLNIVEKTCQNMLETIAGHVVMTTECSDAIEQLSVGKVPYPWRAASWECDSLSRWTSSMRQRIEQLDKWSRGKKKGGRVIWLGGLFFPRGFLTAVKQELIRSTSSWQLDTITLRVDVTKYMTLEQLPPAIEESSAAFFIHGLSLEGGAWDRGSNHLVDAAPRSLFSSLPILKLSVRPVVSSGGLAQQGGGGAGHLPLSSSHYPRSQHRSNEGVQTGAAAAATSGGASVLSGTLNSTMTMNATMSGTVVAGGGSVDPSSRQGQSNSGQQQPTSGAGTTTTSGSNLAATGSAGGGVSGHAPYMCPVYQHPSRAPNSYVMEIPLRTSDHDPPGKWVLRGLAAVCSTH